MKVGILALRFIAASLTFGLILAVALILLEIDIDLKQTVGILLAVRLGDWAAARWGLGLMAGVCAVFAEFAA